MSVRAARGGAARPMVRTKLVAFVLMTVSAFTSAPAGAQVSGALQAEPVLGVLQIDPKEGEPGDVVAAELDPDLIADSCNLSLEEFQAQATALWSGPFRTAAQEFQARRGWDTAPPDFETNPEAWSVLAIEAILFGVQGFPGVPERVFSQSFALTFADIATQAPVGTLSSFDPLTGSGTVMVPDVDPGNWAVAATCLEWNQAFDVDMLEAAATAGAAWLEANAEQPYPPSLASPGTAELAEQLAPTVLGEGVLVPGATWVEFFCVTENGVCPATPPPTVPGGGDDPADPADPPVANVAQPVVASPNFTG